MFTPGGNNPSLIRGSAHDTHMFAPAHEALKGGSACGPRWVPVTPPFFELAGQNHCSQLLDSFLTCVPTSWVSVSSLTHPTSAMVVHQVMYKLNNSKPSINLPNFVHLIKQIFFSHCLHWIQMGPIYAPNFRHSLFNLAHALAFQFPMYDFLGISSWMSHRQEKFTLPSVQFIISHTQTCFPSVMTVLVKLPITMSRLLKPENVTSLIH